MHYAQQSECISHVQSHCNSTHKKTYQAHGHSMEVWQTGFGKSINTDFEPLHHLDT